jgi:Alginate export
MGNALAPRGCARSGDRLAAGPTAAAATLDSRGYDYSSGDADPADDRHGTFFQVLPTARIYARTPFFNMMNTVDAFGEVILRPSNRLTLRGDVHSIRLAAKNDLWYAGGGAFQPATFGFNGRPSNGHSDLATLYDVSGDVTLNPHVAFGLYYGYARSGAVTRAVYPTGDGLHLAFVEWLIRF